MIFKGKKVLITGTSKGIGEFLTNKFLSEGAEVEGCSRSENKIVDKNFVHTVLDIIDPNALEKWIYEIGKRKNKIDILINNAGAASMNHMALTPHSTVERLLLLNVAATFNCSRNAIRYLKKSQKGKIINFSSVAVPLRLEGESIYSATKAAVEQLTKVFAKDLASFNIDCNCIGPSPIDTDLIKNVSDEKIKDLVDSLPSKRKGTLEELWELVKFFAGTDSDSLTGQIVYMGGLS